MSSKNIFEYSFVPGISRMSQTLVQTCLSHKDKKIEIGLKEFPLWRIFLYLVKGIWINKGAWGGCKIWSKHILILLQLDALVVGENMLLVKRSFSNLDLLHPVLRARQSWQILFNARTVQLASWGGRGEDCQRYDDDFMSMRKMVLYTFHL